MPPAQQLGLLIQERHRVIGPGTDWLEEYRRGLWSEPPRQDRAIAAALFCQIGRVLNRGVTKPSRAKAVIAAAVFC
jgi:hypothetical protein